jgi:hypothetical protein
MKKLVMVDCLSQFRIRYCVEVEDDIDHALDEIICNYEELEFQEFSQEHLRPSPIFISHREISKEEYLRMFDEDNGYLKSWTEEQKLKFINTINYEKTEILGG